MAEVKGSKQYRSIVVRYRPWCRVALIGLLLAIMLVIAFASTWVARSDFVILEKRLLNENGQLQQDLHMANNQKDEAQQQLVNQQMAASVDRTSVDDVRQELKDYQDKIAELTEEISFYKGLMSPSERDKGLSVRDLDIYKTASPHLFQYKLVLQQTALKHRLLKGSVRVVIIGQAKNSEGVNIQRRYALADLSEDIKAVDIPLRFKYFQNIEGELKLPNGFNVQKIELVARAISPKKVQIEKTYDWQVQG
jgi:Family of unknown function (DUF6776)